MHVQSTLLADMDHVLPPSSLSYQQMSVSLLQHREMDTLFHKMWAFYEDFVLYGEHLVLSV